MLVLKTALQNKKSRRVALHFSKAAAVQESWWAGWQNGCGPSVFPALYNPSGCCWSRDRVYRPMTSAGNEHVEGRPFPEAAIITIQFFYFHTFCSWSLSLGWVLLAASLQLAQLFSYTIHGKNYPALPFSLGQQNAVLSVLPTNLEPNCQKSCMCCPDGSVPGKKGNLV